jgi:hypothetical protein
VLEYSINLQIPSNQFFEIIWRKSYGDGKLKFEIQYKLSKKLQSKFNTSQARMEFSKGKDSEGKLMVYKCSNKNYSHKNDEKVIEVKIEDFNCKTVNKLGIIFEAKDEHEIAYFKICFMISVREF